VSRLFKRLEPNTGSYYKVYVCEESGNRRGVTFDDDIRALKVLRTNASNLVKGIHERIPRWVSRPDT
jgi:hypothetical protein